MNPFDLVNAINSKKNVEWTEEAEKEYKPFIINRNFAKTADTVLFAAEMDLASGLDKKLQYDFYFYGVSKGKRFEKGITKDRKSDKEQLVIDLLNVNLDCAKNYVRILDTVTPDWEIEEVKRLEKGGRKR